jgi:hypothetical protein
VFFSACSARIVVFVLFPVVKKQIVSLLHKVGVLPVKEDIVNSGVNGKIFTPPALSVTSRSTLKVIIH